MVTENVNFICAAVVDAAPSLPPRDRHYYPNEILPAAKKKTKLKQLVNM